MKSLYDSVLNHIVSEELDMIDHDIICEKLNAKVLRDIVKQLKDIHVNDQERLDKEYEERVANGTAYWGKSKTRMSLFRDIFGTTSFNQRVEWDKITDSDIEKIDASDWDDPKKAANLRKRIRKVVTGNEQSIIFSKNGDKFEFVLFPWGDVRFLFVSGYNATGAILRNGSKSMNQREKIEKFIGKELYIINDVNVKQSKLNIKLNDRRAEKNGMIYLDEQSLKLIAQNNLERYRKIIAQNKAKEENDQNEMLMKRAGEIIEKIAHLASVVARDPIINADMVEPVNVLCQYVHDQTRYVSTGRSNGYYTGKDGLLPNLMKYSKAVLSTKKTGSSYDKGVMDSAKKSIEKTIAQIEKYAKEKDIDI